MSTMTTAHIEDSLFKKLLQNLGDLQNSRSIEDSLMIEPSCYLKDLHHTIRNTPYTSRGETEELEIETLPIDVYTSLLHKEGGSLFLVLQILKRFPSHLSDDHILIYLNNASKYLSQNNMSGLKRKGSFYIYTGHSLPKFTLYPLSESLEHTGYLPFETSEIEDFRTLCDELFIRVATISEFVPVSIKDEQTIGSILQCIYDHVVYHETYVHNTTQGFLKANMKTLTGTIMSLVNKSYDALKSSSIRSFEEFIHSLR
jgi:hypothetical protein